MGKKRIRLILFIVDMQYGGTPRHIQQVAERLDKNIFDISVLCIREKSEVAYELESKDIKVDSLKVRRKIEVGYIFKLLKFFRKEKPDILLAYIFHANILARIIGKLLCRVPTVIISERSVESEKKKYRILIDRLFSFLCDGVLVNSEKVKEVLTQRERIESEKIKVIPNGVDTKIFKKKAKNFELKRQLGFNNEDYIISVIGRFELYKGQEYFLSAFKKVLEQKPNVSTKTLLVGEGRFKNKIQDIVRKLGMMEKVILTGARSDVAELLSITDLFVLPSTEEGMSNALLEAMSCKVPVIATQVGGTSEVIGDGVNGFLVPPADTNLMAEHIMDFLDNKKYLSNVTDSARQTIVENYTVESMMQKLTSYLLSMARRMNAL